jgi:lipopolysaccharide export system permease protein
LRWVLDRYLIREITKPIVVVCSILVFIFAGYKAADYLNDAVSGLLPRDTVLLLILLKLAIAMEVLLPTTLFLSVVFTLGRLHRDSEILALHASGISTARIARPVFLLALFVAVMVATLSLWVRPWAYQRGYQLKAEAEAGLDLGRMESATFYQIGEQDRVLFAEKIDQERLRAENIFIHSEVGSSTRVIWAKEARQQEDPATGRKVILFMDGYVYEFSRETEGGRVIQFSRSTVSIWPGDITPEDKIKAAPTARLAATPSHEALAELQWRISMPISALLLALLGVPLSRTSHRQGKYDRVVLAIAIYAIYYNLVVVARTWVEQGRLAGMPGLFPVQAVLALIISIWLLREAIPQWRHRRGGHHEDH